MLKILIMSLLNAAAVAGGIWGAQLIRNDSRLAETTDGHEGLRTESVNMESPETTPAIDDDFFPMRFSRPFVIPVTDGWRTEALVVLQLNVELARDELDGTVGLEEKVRDRIMKSLVAYSHGGGFSGAVTDPDVQEAVRMEVHAAVEEMLPGKTGNILILEILKRKV